MSVECKESEGVECVLQIIEAFKGRTFRVRGGGIRASHVPAEEVARFIREELPGYYTYTARVETYTSRNEVRHAHAEIKGWVGLSRRMNRYNPFDLTCVIRTEAPINA